MGLSAYYEKEKGKKRLFVYAMVKRDIQISKIYLDKTKNPSTDIYERDSNIIALYVVYSRIFSKSNNGDLPIFNFQVIKCKLTDDEKALHEQILIGRNKFFAHSDPTVNEMMIGYNDEGNLVTAPSMHTSVIEKHYDIAKTLFDKILTSVDNEINMLLELIYNQNDNFKLNTKEYVVLGYRNEFYEHYKK